MANYIEGTLIKDEKVVYIGKISLWPFAPPIFFGFLLLPLFGLGLIFWLLVFIRYSSTELAVTNKRVVAKFGLISRRTIEINISKVESVQIRQGIFGRILNFGSLVVSGSGNPLERIHGISSPINFRRAIMDVQESLPN